MKPVKWMACFGLAGMVALLSFGCGRGGGARESTLSTTRPASLVDAQVPLTDDYGAYVTNYGGATVMIDAPKVSLTQTGETKSAQLPWPQDILPAGLPVAVRAVDRVDERTNARGHVVTVFVTEMPYEAFLEYTEMLLQAGAERINADLPEQAPTRRNQAVLAAKLGAAELAVLWSPATMNGFVANFQLSVSGAF
ncbi:MAG: hypothetical protein LBC83_08595 [Oscillospiraceae bacterium]|jgi:hypothetical protein|nr:hypothetical protein [Oscillospiraceae bacterium]